MQESLPALSEGEKQCLRLVAQGFNSKEIARKLLISEHTVDQRVRTVLRKLHVPSRQEAARLFIMAERESPHPGTYQPLIYQPDRLAPTHDPAPSSIQPEKPGSQSRWLKLLRSILAFGPPLGGSTNELSVDGRILAMIRAAVLTAVGVVTLLLLIAGVFKTLA
ncbi:helix-turn-helix transcriptional regulator [Sphingobium sp. AN641]|uniref:helix-turn-helix domain-containing protein n=1 Tax=Sphingobium sp. AN641 TaxID=3133443 RepID=UPI0030C4A7DF